MKRIKDIIKAYIITRRSPSAAIREAWNVVKSRAPGGPSTELIDDMIEAIIAEAEDLEKPAKDEVKA